MKLLVRLLKYVAPHRKWLALTLATMAAGTAFDLCAPWLLQQVVDRGITEKSMYAVILFTGLLAAGQLVKSAVMYLQGFSQEKLGQNVMYDMRIQLYRHLQRLSFGYFDKAQTGQIMSRMTGDIDAVKNFISFGSLQLVMSGLTFVGTIAIMLSMQWQVTLISIIPMPLLILVLIRFNRKVGPAWGQIREQMGKLTTTLQENISGIRVVKAFAQEKLEKSKFQSRNDTNFDSNMSRAKIEAGSFPLMMLFGGGVFLLMNWVGCIYVVNGKMTLGQLTAFQWYAWGIIWPLNMLGWLVNIAQQAMKAAPRIFEIADAQIDVDNMPGGGISAANIRGRVALEDVRFHFAPDEGKEPRSVLEIDRLQVEPGDAVAILGATGSGKSIFIQLIARFYDAATGSVRIDGRDVKEYSLEELRRKIGIVPQETFLFSATIRDNIAFGQPVATQEQIEWAARKAQIHDFILTMPHGYDTLIGERGVGLSGGQRQRVALARAILMDPPILILDEATASVDTATESAIHEALHEVMHGRTTFIVAQRLSSIQRADRLIVLEDGRIVEQGTHQELYDRKGFYYKLAQLQQTAEDGFEPAPEAAVARA